MSEHCFKEKKEKKHSSRRKEVDGRHSKEEILKKASDDKRCQGKLYRKPDEHRDKQDHWSRVELNIEDHVTNSGREVRVDGTCITLRGK